MEKNTDKLKNWGIFFAGLGVLLIGIALLITAFRCPKCSRMNEFFKSPHTKTEIKTHYSSNPLPSYPVTSFKKVEFSDEELEKAYESFVTGLKEQQILEEFIPHIDREEFKAKMRKALEGSQLKLISQKTRKTN